MKPRRIRQVFDERISESAWNFFLTIPGINWWVYERRKVNSRAVAFTKKIGWIEVRSLPMRSEAPRHPWNVERHLMRLTEQGQKMRDLIMMRDALRKNKELWGDR